MPNLVVLAQDTEVPPAAPAAPTADAPAELKTVEQKMGYAIGLNIGQNLKRQQMDLDPQAIALGIAHVLAGKEPLITMEQIQAASAEYDQIREQQRVKLGAENKAAADKFLTENIKKDGVKVTKSGLQYVVLKEGTGATPTEENTVSTHYRGKLLTGKVFDESYTGEVPTADESPVSFGVTQVISGWTEALQLMKVGAKYRLFIPPAMAYGENGPPGIGPNSLLIFDIELISVK
ncbi:MAG: FKBP-type peptidyl-prolyl cis-trans isomerase [Planctomycetaceae bacterium]